MRARIGTHLWQELPGRNWQAKARVIGGPMRDAPESHDKDAGRGGGPVGYWAAGLRRATTLPPAINPSR